MERSLQELVWQRAGNRCEYCQMPQSSDPIPFEIDHIIAEPELALDDAPAEIGYDRDVLGSSATRPDSGRRLS
jgi:hypothetical protein